MKLKRTKGGLLDIIRVVENASEVTAAEAETAGFTPWTLTKALWQRLKDGEAITVSDASGPLFVLGHYPDPLRSDNRLLWFIATDGWFELGATSVRFGRRFMRELRAAHPRCSFTSVSWSKHPDLCRWFAFQGFVLEERAGEATVFKCARKG